LFVLFFWVFGRMESLNTKVHTKLFHLRILVWFNQLMVASSLEKTGL
jgi:hypothetical protein